MQIQNEIQNPNYINSKMKNSRFKALSGPLVSSSKFVPFKGPSRPSNTEPQRAIPSKPTNWVCPQWWARWQQTSAFKRIQCAFCKFSKCTMENLKPKEINEKHLSRKRRHYTSAGPMRLRSTSLRSIRLKNQQRQHGCHRGFGHRRSWAAILWQQSYG